MDRSDFLKKAIAIPFMFSTSKVQALEAITSQFTNTEKMPVLFIGHGHPMNALFNNSFTQALQRIGKTVPKPNAIMMISAHWETKGSFVSVNPNPKAIYDFGGFDRRLFDIKYEPKGHPALAKEVMNMLPGINEHATMGLDHGAWTVLKFMYPNADIPVFQLSIDYTQSPAKHYEMAQALRKMREKGVLIIGSGNIVHNLGRLDWGNINAKTESWALEFDEQVKQRLDSGNFSSLVNYKAMGAAALMSVPSEDHYLPMLYTLGFAARNEPVTYLYEGFQYANISMRCFKIG